MTRHPLTSPMEVEERRPKSKGQIRITSPLHILFPFLMTAPTHANDPMILKRRNSAVATLSPIMGGEERGERREGGEEREGRREGREERGERREGEEIWRGEKEETKAKGGEKKDLGETGETTWGTESTPPRLLPHRDLRTITAELRTLIPHVTTTSRTAGCSRPPSLRRLIPTRTHSAAHSTRLLTLALTLPPTLPPRLPLPLLIPQIPQIPQIPLSPLRGTKLLPQFLRIRRIPSKKWKSDESDCGTVKGTTNC